MTDKRKPDRKNENEKQKPEENGFGLDINFEEALERFLNVDPKELEKERPQKSGEDT